MPSDSAYLEHGRAATGRGLYLTVQYQISLYKNWSKVILSLSTASITHQPAMSLFADSLSLRRKRTATERALNNADPLIVKKKARQAAGIAVGKTAAATLNPAPDNGVSHIFFRLLEDLVLTSHPNRLIVVLLSSNVMIVTSPPT
jgi:hypothetical protein